MNIRIALLFTGVVVSASSSAHRLMQRSPSIQTKRQLQL